MIERIKRVINNHQLSCQDSNNYLYVLRGFKPIINNIEIPVSHLSDEIENNKNYYALEEDWNHEELPERITMNVDFNFFNNGLLNEKGEIVEISPSKYDSLNIFNTVNPLIGVHENLELNDNEKLEYLKEINIL